MESTVRQRPVWVVPEVAESEAMAEPGLTDAATRAPAKTEQREMAVQPVETELM